MAEKEEIVAEVEALEAVYGDDCVVVETFPPHIHLHIKPRTADDSSLQFVEVLLRVRAGPKYPKEPPQIVIIDSKGLDEQRQKHLISSIQERASELSNNLMLVVLCEEAVEKLSHMNHPDGDCPLCLNPLLSEDEWKNSVPFMKLMSCFHCFHRGDMGRNTGNCPVCRKAFDIKDIEHVLDVHSSQLNVNVAEAHDEESVLQSELENIRRQKFESIFSLQQENGGLIEPKKDEVLLPGMYLPQLNAPPAIAYTEETTEQQTRAQTVSSGRNLRGSSNRPRGSGHRSMGMGKQRAQNPKKQARQWVKRENSTPDSSR
ncbi:RWD domain [Dillenia turbinata]|uniref:RWD domain n=1 Tax=Dillenia turbinata TaxID=194707 RepID=A0AAN8Z236_9MAGN